MPFIRFTYTDEELEVAEASGKRLVRAQTVPPEKAITIFRMQQGLLKGTAQQQEYCKRVHKVYISRELAPADYLAVYPRAEVVTPVVPQIQLPYKD